MLKRKAVYELPGYGFFQLLELMRNRKFVWTKGRCAQKPQLHLAVLIHKLEMWHHVPGALEHHAYTMLESSVIDFLKLAPFHQMRKQIKQWDIGTSDVAGCFLLHSPRLALPQQCAIDDENCPEIVLLDRMLCLPSVKGKGATRPEP